MNHSIKDTSPKYNFFITMLAIATAILIPALYSLIWRSPGSGVDNLVHSIPAEIILVIVAIFLSTKLGLNRIGFKKPLWRKLYWLIPEILLLVAIIASIERPALVPWPKVIIELFLLAILVGIYEEFLSRGIVLHVLARFGKIELAILGSGLVFGMLHISNYNGINGTETFLQILETFSAGVYGAVMALVLRSIVPLMITHFIYDFSLFIKLYFDSLSVTRMTPEITHEITQTALLDFTSYIMPLAYLLTAFTIYFFERKNIKAYHQELHEDYSSSNQLSSGLIIKFASTLCLIIVGFNVVSDLIYKSLL